MPRLQDDPPPRRPQYFWWFVANSLALAFAVLAWAMCLHVFGHPEIPRNHRWLEKLGRAPELKAHTVLSAPNAPALDPRDLYSRFFALDAPSRDRLNAVMLRDYLTNFQRQRSLTYVQGDFRVEAVRVLGAADFIQTGFAVRARAMVKPDDFTEAAPYPVVIEYMFPTSQVHVADHFAPGDVLEVRKSPNCAAILHVGKEFMDDEPVLVLTVVPIAYGSYQLDAANSFAITVPEGVDPGGSLPVFRH